MAIGTIFTFAATLKSIGVPVPDDTIKVTIDCMGYNSTVRIVFHTLDVSYENIVRKVGVKVLKDDGSELLAQDFYNLMKDVVEIPSETTSFYIEADMDKVVTLQVNAAFPLEAIEKLQGFTFK